MKRKALFITFEGGEGTGKSTQIKKTHAWLKKLGYSVAVTKEPGGKTRLGQEIRDLVLNRKYHPLSPRSELLLYEADRAQHVDYLIRPLLKKGRL